MTSELERYYDMLPALYRFKDQAAYFAACRIDHTALNQMYPTYQLYRNDMFDYDNHQYRFDHPIVGTELSQTGIVSFSHPKRWDEPMLEAKRSIVNHHSKGKYPERSVRMRIYPNYGANVILMDRAKFGINQVALALNHLGNVAPTMRAYKNGSMYTGPRHVDHTSEYPLFPADESTVPDLYTESVMKWTRQYLNDVWGLGMLLPDEGTQGLFSPQELFRVLVSTPPLMRGQGDNAVDFRYMMEQAGLI